VIPGSTHSAHVGHAKVLDDLARRLSASRDEIEELCRRVEHLEEHLVAVARHAA
jgi:hypothetical protein